jgi:HK97 family phage prohead protease
MEENDYIKNMPDSERRFVTEPVGFEVRAGAKDENVIEGYAAVFNKNSEDFGGWVERIAPGAFDEVLQDDTVGLLNHNMNQILGRNGKNMTLSVDNIGLKYRIALPDTTLAKDTRQLIKDEIISKSSFAFTVREQSWVHPEKKEEPSIRTIVKVRRLYDVSPVTMPAYPDTTVGARSFKREDPKDFTLRNNINAAILNSHERIGK